MKPSLLFFIAGPAAYAGGSGLGTSATETKRWKCTKVPNRFGNS